MKYKQIVKYDKNFNVKSIIEIDEQGDVIEHEKFNKNGLTTYHQTNDCWERYVYRNRGKHKTYTNSKGEWYIAQSNNNDYVISYKDSLGHWNHTERHDPVTINTYDYDSYGCKTIEKIEVNWIKSDTTQHNRVIYDFFGRPILNLHRNGKWTRFIHFKDEIVSIHKDGSINRKPRPKINQFSSNLSEPKEIHDYWMNNMKQYHKHEKINIKQEQRKFDELIAKYEV